MDPCLDLVAIMYFRKILPGELDALSKAPEFVKVVPARCNRKTPVLFAVIAPAACY
jgi:hypothetical protein